MLIHDHAGGCSCGCLRQSRAHQAFTENLQSMRGGVRIFALLFANHNIIRSLSRNAELGIQCPIEEGDYEVEHTVALPKEIPPGMMPMCQ